MTLHLQSGMSDVPMKPSFLHRFWSKKCASHFCRETTNKNIQFSKWKHGCNTWSDKALKGIVVYQNIIYFFSKSFRSGQCNAMQCRMKIAWGRAMKADLILKEPSPHGCPIRGWHACVSPCVIVWFVFYVWKNKIT